MFYLPYRLIISQSDHFTKYLFPEILQFVNDSQKRCGSSARLRNLAVQGIGPLSKIGHAFKILIGSYRHIIGFP